MPHEAADEIDEYRRAIQLDEDWSLLHERVITDTPPLLVLGDVIAMHLGTEFLHLREEVVLNHFCRQKALYEDALVLLPIRASRTIEVERFDGTWDLLRERCREIFHGYLSMNG
jgi:hypothetical protein